MGMSPQHVGTGRKKICHLTSVHVPFDTRIFHRECKSLVEAGYEVHLIAGHDRDEIIGGIHVHAVPRITNKIERILRVPAAVYRKALAERYDLYHFHDPELIPVGLLLKARGRKVVYDVHEDYPVYFACRETFPRTLRKPLAWAIDRIERCTGGRFDAAVAATPTIYERFARLNPHTTLVHNYPSLDTLSPDEPSVPWETKDDAFVYVGSLTMDRGIREMVRAAGLIQDKVPARMILAGEFVSRSDEESIRNMPEFRFVDYLGRTTREETMRLYARAKVGVVVCHPHAHYQLAYPTKLFEYMSAGLPVIASRFPLWRNIIKEVGCGLTVDPLNPEALAEAVARLLLNRDETREMGARGKEAVIRRYNWEREKQALVHLYDQLVGS